MSYIDAKKIGDTVFVTERNNGVRKVRSFPAPYYFYVNCEDEISTHTSMFDEPLRKVSCRDYKNFHSQIEILKQNGYRLYESDVKIEYKLLEKEYTDTDIGNPHVLFTDIETETPIAGRFADYENPYGEINAITNHLKWLGLTKTYARIPPTLSLEEAENLVSDIPNVFLYEDEASLLNAFIDDVKDADIITGWNSSLYDIPYIIQRIRIVFGNEKIEDIGSLDLFDPSDESLIKLSELSPFDFQTPKIRVVESYGKPTATFDLIGTIHIDYLDLYKKFSSEELHSYSLDYVLNHEISENKIPYNGTLDQLWKQDFRKFCEYSIQDVVGLVKMDKKLQYIDLANQMAHQSCVFIKDALGSVSIIEQAILVELHKQGKIAPDKKPVEKNNPVAGAFVYLPQGGMYDWICSFDINSLYPSVIRMLNISPETVIGQFDTSWTESEIERLIDQGFAETRTEAWHHFTGVLEYHEIADIQSDKLLTMVTEDGDEITLTAKEWHEFFEKENMCLTANGTVFDLNKMGIIPFCLTKWYDDRKSAQKTMRDCDASGDTDGHIFWNRRQYVLKIFLNSCYGALLNAWFRFGDQRFGQSVTLSGRVVTKHMLRKANEIISGDYDFGEICIYGDTDSAYVSIKSIADALDPTSDDYIDNIVAASDLIGEQINQSFPEKMKEKLFVTLERGGIIKAGREIVARRGIFKHETKKRYALFVIDEEKKRKEKLKIVGMETQRSDTPKWIQEFLSNCVKLIVQEGKEYSEVVPFIRKFREEFMKRDEWTLGRPCRVSKLTEGVRLRKRYELKEIQNPRLHFSVIAADNFNQYREFFGDTLMNVINDGDKIEVFDILKDPINNPLRFESIGVPVGTTLWADWVKRLPIDYNSAYEKLVIKKLNNMFDMMKWDFNIKEESGFVFD